MEKFTVDLDKVLDEFEFNEEQAIRHALPQLKREDLPATKYQKPHFKPINIADADFSPSIETTMNHSSFHNSYSPDQEVTPQPKPISLNLPNSKLSELNESGINSCQNKIDSISSSDKSKDDFSEIKKEVNCNNETLEEKTEEIHNHDVSITKSDFEEKNEIKKQEHKVYEDEDIKDVCVSNDRDLISESENEIKTNLQKEAVEEVKETNMSEKIYLSEETEKEEKVIPELKSETRLPDVAEVSYKVATVESIADDTLDLIKNDKECKSDLKSELGVNLKSEPEIDVISVPDQEPLKDTTAILPTEAREKPPVEEPIVEKKEIKPIQFESQLDITDEELTKYLEELEEEEEEEERKKKGSERKPSRPDTLDLNKETEEVPLGSPGLTPLPKDVNVQESGLNEENNANESAEANENRIEETRNSMTESNEFSSTVEGSRSLETTLTLEERRLGKVSPFWVPDNSASSCMECDSKFTMIKRRHHCRACGRILCSKCCGMRATLEYLQNQEQRVCETCFRTLAKVMMYDLQNESEEESSPRRRPNPNNPMEYCSTVPPPLQVSSSNAQSPPSVMVPVGVLKREGSSKVKEAPKQVMFSDGIRPGGDLTELDGSGDHRNTFRKSSKTSKRVGTPPGSGSMVPSNMLPPIDPVSQSFIVEKSIPPICITNKGETTYEENWPLSKIMDRLKDPKAPPLQFAINRNLVASVKIVTLDCCMKETCWVIVSKGMGCVGQDELIVLLTLNGEEDDKIPKEVFLQFHYIYQEASRGNTVNELGCWCVKESPFLDSPQHGGFLFIRPTFQCLNHIETPPPPFLVGVLIHRSEIPWARVFPFRLMLRLGAEFRYYPCPLVSVRFREPVYYEIGHTIINLLADFRNLSYTIPSVRGLRIHMEANQTSILIPRNRYDQVVRALNNSNDPVLALAGNFSPEADAHLVCMQSSGNEVTYSTHAININDKPRKVTGASFVVLNGALKTTSGVAAKSSIVEDGLMVQVPSDTMVTLRTKLRNMEDWSVRCGPVEGRATEEIVKIVWCEDDKNFNVGVKSVIDNMALDGVPSIRVHSSKDYVGCSKFIRWTQVFIIKCEDGATSAKIGDPLEVNKLSESIARATCIALTKLLELLAASSLTVLAVRATIDQDNVGYEAGSNGEKLAPIYMNSLDNELIPVLHKAASVNDSVAVLELIFHIMDL